MWSDRLFELVNESLARECFTNITQQTVQQNTTNPLSTELRHVKIPVYKNIKYHHFHNDLSFKPNG